MDGSEWFLLLFLSLAARSLAQNISASNHTEDPGSYTCFHYIFKFNYRIRSYISSVINLCRLSADMTRESSEQR